MDHRGTGQSVTRITWSRGDQRARCDGVRETLAVSDCRTVVMLLTFILSIISIPSPLTPSFQAYNLPFLQILTTAAFPFLLQDWSHGFLRLFTVTSEHIRFYFLAWASTPLEHWGRAPKTRESRRRKRRGGWGLGRGCAPSQKIYEFLPQNGVIWCIWKWQRLAVFRSSAEGKKIKHLSK